MNTSKSLFAVLCISTLAPLAAGCDPAPVVATDAPTFDAGSPGLDAGGMPDVPPAVDTGPADPCAETETGAAAAATLGCNGPVGGPTRAANAQGGTCTMDSCTDARSTCRADGYCQVACTPGMLYVSTGGCPSGSRCFPTGGGAGLCFLDCNTAADCPIPGSTCDAEFSCIPPAAMPIDAGAVDGGGVGVDGGDSDGGVLDAGTVDGGDVDAG